VAKCREAGTKSVVNPGSVNKVLIRKPSIIAGEYHWVKWDFSLISHRDNDSPIGFLCIGTDVTVEKNVTEKLLEANRTLNTVIANTTDQIVILDPNLHILNSNYAASSNARRILQMQVEVNTPFLHYIPSEIKPIVSAMLEQALIGNSVSKEIDVTVKQELQSYMVRCSPLYTAQKKLSGITIIYSDITSLREANLKIEKQNSALKKIVRIQAHEMRAPVSNLLSIAHQNKSYDDQISEEERRVYFNAIGREAHRLDETIHRIIAEINQLNLSDEEWNSFQIES
jgi:nitrogen-specific signal transduction histidine kinase